MFVIFLGNLPKQHAPWTGPTIDVGGSIENPLSAMLVDVALIALLFGLQHSLMARPHLKKWWSAAIPQPLERATYVHAANVALLLLLFLWQPIPIVVWQAQEPLLRTTMWVLFALGWVLLLAASLSFGLFELLELQQIWSWYKGRTLPSAYLRTSMLYRWLRHPRFAWYRARTAAPALAMPASATNPPRRVARDGNRRAGIAFRIPANAPLHCLPAVAKRWRSHRVQTPVLSSGCSISGSHPETTIFACDARGVADTRAQRPEPINIKRAPMDVWIRLA